MDDYGPSDVRAGDVLYEEPGDTNDDEDDLSNVEIADILYTRDWTSISTDDDADAFVVDLLQHATPNERAYISNIYLGKWNGSNALKIIRDKIVAMRTYLADLEARAQEFRADLSDSDVRDTFLQNLNVPPVITNQMIRFMEEFYEKELVAQQGIAAQQTRGIPVSGGSAPGIEDKYDYRLYQLLQLADALHDFDPAPPFDSASRVTVDRENIISSMGIVVPKDLIKSLDNLVDDAADEATAKRYRRCLHEDFPRDYMHRPYDAIAYIPAFIDYMKGHDRIEFPDGAVIDNPLWDVDILRRFDIPAALNAVEGDLWEAFRIQERAQPHRSGLVSVEVWCPLIEKGKVETGKVYPDNKTPRQAAKSNRDIKTHKKTVRMAQITNLVKKLKDFFGNTVTFIVDASDNQMTRMVIATEKIDGAISRQFLIDRDGDSERPKVNWTYAICDANVLDAVKHFKEPWQDQASPEVSRAVTGSVYREEDSTKIELLGVNRANEVKYSIDGVSITQSHAMELYSSNDMAKAMQRKLIRGNGDVSEELACKRVCDWGQVEHCVQHSSPDRRFVFASSDRLAGYYGIYRHASVLSINRRNHTHFMVPTVSELLQCTFTMSKPEAVRDNTLIVDALGAESSGGRNKRNVTLSIVLGFVTIAAAVVQSMFRI